MKTLKLHAALRWETILGRINAAEGFAKFNLDQYGNIYKQRKGQFGDIGYYLVACTASDKESFIYEHTSILCKH